MDLLTSATVVCTDRLADSCRNVAWSGQLLVVAGDDGVILRSINDRPWVVDGHNLEVVGRLGAPPSAIATSADHFACGGLDGSILLGSQGSRSVTPMGASVRAMAWAGSDLAVACRTTVQVLTPEAGLAIDLGIGQVTTLAPVTGRVVLAGGVGGAVWFDTALGTNDGRIELPTIVSLAVDPQRRAAAAGDLGGSIHLLRPEGGESMELTGYPDRVELVAWMASGSGLCAAADDEMTVWPVTVDGNVEATAPLQFIAHQSPVTMLAASPTADLVVTGDADGMVHLWAPFLVDRPVASLSLDGLVLAAAWRPDGRMLALTTAPGTLYRAEVRPGEVV